MSDEYPARTQSDDAVPLRSGKKVSTMQRDTIFRHGDVLSASTKAGVVFMHVDSGQYLLLENTALEIWSLVDGERSVGEIIALLVADFDVDAGTCAAEVEAFLAEVLELGLIEDAA